MASITRRAKKQIAAFVNPDGLATALALSRGQVAEVVFDRLAMDTGHALRQFLHGTRLFDRSLVANRQVRERSRTCSVDGIARHFEVRRNEMAGLAGER
jgi:hypothetical protein